MNSGRMGDSSQHHQRCCPKIGSINQFLSHSSPNARPLQPSTNSQLTLLIPGYFLMLVYRGGGGEKTPPPENQLLRNKNTFSLHEVKFCINLAWFWGIALIFSWILMNFGVFGIKMTEKAIFYKNWATCKLYTSKESWNHLEIDFLAKKYDLF